ncbi:MAG TPA: hypothetical protein VMN78_13825 [Longimicrobiales bacterium]|nr:hypothetical protein [Longimicrobiales bacterium]
MRIGVFAVAALAAVNLSCGGQTASDPAGIPLPLDPAERLEAILATPITFEQDSLYTDFVAEHERAIERLLPALALDRTAPALARANAVLRMGQRLMLAFDVYGRTIEDPDPRVRGATLGVVGPLATRTPPQALPIIARGLVDPEIGIQAKALQELRDRDLDLLRFYLSTDPPPELRVIALQTLRSSLAWGAPLAPEADGTLRRVSPAEVELVLRPDTVWPEWDAVMGTLTASAPGEAPRVIADSVEAVATIIPAVVDPAGRYVAVETARRIEVHDLQTGETRLVDAGIAPRPMPFTPDFLFFRELARRPLVEGTMIRYEILRAPFAGEAPVVFDTVSVNARPDLRGYLSPLRWVRIHDRGTRFVLHTDGLSNHALPTPGDAMMLAPDESH